MRRIAVAGVLSVVVVGLAGALLSAQMANFTGAVKNMDAADLRTVRFQYEAGARSYWHVHDGIQVLLIEKGRGRFQFQGKPVQEMLPGQPVFLPPGVPHWHGAAPDEGLTWISTSIGGVKWMQEVTDKEYRAAAAR
jgi:quercetin dioxygenase-like cupin family protein